MTCAGGETGTLRGTWSGAQAELDALDPTPAQRPAFATDSEVELGGSEWGPRASRRVREEVPIEGRWWKRESGRPELVGEGREGRRFLHLANPLAKVLPPHKKEVSYCVGESFFEGSRYYWSSEETEGTDLGTYARASTGRLPARRSVDLLPGPSLVLRRSALMSDQSWLASGPCARLQARKVGRRKRRRRPFLARGKLVVPLSSSFSRQVELR